MIDPTQAEKNARELAGLGTRVTGIEQTITSMRQDTHAAFTAMRQETQASLGQITSAVQGLASSMNERSKTPWGVIFSGLGVLVTVLGLTATLLYAPVKDAQTKAEMKIEKLDDAVVPRVEMMERWRANERDKDAISKRLDKLEDKTDGLHK